MIPDANLNLNVIANVAAVKGTVHLDKPFFLSKKLWIAAIGLALAAYAAFSGHDAASMADVLDKIAKVAAVLGVIVPLILSIAHVDGKEREIALALIDTAKHLGDEEAK